VNVASACGYTRQYKDLQKLYETYGDKLVVLGVPCNQFGGQESGSLKEIKEFCSTEFQVTFPMTEKVKVKGDGQHPLYQWLTSKNKNGKMDATVGWNFHKFLIDENGDLLESYTSGVNPMDEAITKYL
jgi:glutathione peroxidase